MAFSNDIDFDKKFKNNLLLGFSFEPNCGY